MLKNVSELRNNPHSYSIIQESTENNTCNCLAWDVNSVKNVDCKLYRGFDNCEDFVFMADCINAHKDGIKFRNKHRVFYEMIGYLCKLYFDFDVKDDVQITVQEFKDFIQNEFLGHLNTFMNLNLTYDDIYIFSRDTDFIRSTHIIVKPFKTTKPVIKYFLKYYLPRVSNHSFVSYFDTAVYTKNRLFNLPFNTKLKYCRTENPRYFMPLEHYKMTPKEYLVSYITGLPLVQYNRSCVYNQVFKYAAKSKLRHAFNNFFQKVNQKDNQKVKQEKVQFYNVKSIMEFLIMHLPEEFYTHSADWKAITRFFKKFDLPENDFIYWNRVSIKGTNYTMEQNNLYVKSIDVEQVKAGIPTLKKIIQKYLPQFDIHYRNQGSNDELTWLNKMTNIDLDILKPLLEDTNTNELHYGPFRYVYQFLYENDTILGNYHFDTYKDYYKGQALVNISYHDAFEELNHIMDTFCFNEERVFALKAKWGSGKTHFAIKRIVRQTKNRVIFLTENNALNKQIEKSLQGEGIHITSHINNQLKYVTGHIVCSLESIQNIQFLPTDTIILDEFETLLNHYESDTFNYKASDSFKIFKQALQNSSKIVICDADISPHRIKLMEGILKTNIHVYQVNINRFADYKFNVFLKNSQWDAQMIQDIENGKKICIASAICNRISVLYALFIKKYPMKKILFVSRHGAFLNQDKLANKNDTLKNLEDVIIENDVDVLLYSPTIKTGVSINSEIFHKCYAYGAWNSTCPREFIQMLFRARVLIDKEINISFSTSIFNSNPKKYTSPNLFRKIIIGNPCITTYLIESIQSKKLQDIGNISRYINEAMYDAEYMDLKLTNAYENYHGQKLYIQDFISRMTINHGIGLTYIDKKEEKKEDKKEEEKEEELKLSHIVDAKLITRLEYFNLKKSNHFNTKTLSYWQLSKAELFYKEMYIHGISNLDEYDTEVYEKINYDLFYQTYMNYHKSEYHNIHRISNNQVVDLLKHYKIGDELAELNFHSKNNAKLCLCNLLLDRLKIDLLKLPMTITNREFDLLIEDKAMKQILYEFLNNTELFPILKYDLKKKQEVIQFIKDTLLAVDVSMKYEDKRNTTRSSDKLIFQYKHFHVKHSFTKTKAVLFRLNEDQVVKFKKGFLYDTGSKKVNAYKQTVKDNVYYTTYKIEMNKKTLSLSKTKNAKYDAEAYKSICQYIRNTPITPRIMKNIESYNDERYKAYCEKNKMEDEV